MLFGRVTDHNTRSTLRSTPTKSQNPFVSTSFKDLDQLVCDDFLENIPTNYKHLGFSDNGGVDTDLYMVHVVPHA